MRNAAYHITVYMYITQYMCICACNMRVYVEVPFAPVDLLIALEPPNARVVRPLSIYVRRLAWHVPAHADQPT